MTYIDSISKKVTPVVQKYGAIRAALFGFRAGNTVKETSDYSFIDKLRKAFGSKVDIIMDTSNKMIFLSG